MLLFPLWLLWKFTSADEKVAPKFVNLNDEGKYNFLITFQEIKTKTETSRYLACSLNLQKVTFTRCSSLGPTILSGSGGAVFLESSDAYFSACNFEKNVATFGGSIFLLDTSSYLDLCNFRLDKSHKNGGSIYQGLNLGPGVANIKLSSALSSCTFFNCSSDISFGAGSFSFIDDLIIKNCTFMCCLARHCGGSLGLCQCTSVILESKFIQNRVEPFTLYQNFSHPNKYDPKTSNITFGGGSIAIRSVSLDDGGLEHAKDILIPPQAQAVISGTCFIWNNNNDLFGADCQDVVGRGNVAVAFTNSSTTFSIEKSVNKIDNHGFHGPKFYMDTSGLTPEKPKCFEEEIIPIVTPIPNTFEEETLIPSAYTVIEFTGIEHIMTYTEYSQGPNPATEGPTFFTPSADRPSLDFSNIKPFTKVIPFLTPTPYPTNTPTLSVSPTSTPSLSVSPSHSISPSKSLSPTSSLSGSLSASKSKTPSLSILPTRSFTPSSSISQSNSPSVSHSISPTASISISPTSSPSVLISSSLTASVSISQSPIASVSASPHPNPKATLWPTRSLNSNEAFVTTVSNTIVYSLTKSVTESASAVQTHGSVIYTASTLSDTHIVVYSSSVFHEGEESMALSSMLSQSLVESYFETGTYTAVTSFTYNFITIEVTTVSYSNVYIYSVYEEEPTEISAGLIIGLATGFCAVALFIAVFAVFLWRKLHEDNDMPSPSQSEDDFSKNSSDDEINTLMHLSRTGDLTSIVNVMSNSALSDILTKSDGSSFGENDESIFGITKDDDWLN